MLEFQPICTHTELLCKRNFSREDNVENCEIDTWKISKAYVFADNRLNWMGEFMNHIKPFRVFLLTREKKTSQYLFIQITVRGGWNKNVNSMVHFSYNVERITVQCHRITRISRVLIFHSVSSPCVLGWLTSAWSALAGDNTRRLHNMQNNIFYETVPSIGFEFNFATRSLSLSLLN